MSTIASLVLKEETHSLLKGEQALKNTTTATGTGKMEEAETRWGTSWGM